MLTRLAKALLPRSVQAALSWAKQTLAQRIADRGVAKQQAAAWDLIKVALPTSGDAEGWFRIAHRDLGSPR